MNILSIDCQDGRPAVQVAVADGLQVDRLRDYLKWISKVQTFLDRVTYMEYVDQNPAGGYWRETTSPSLDIFDHIQNFEESK